MRITKKYLNELTYKVIGCAIEVHKHLGPGLSRRIFILRDKLESIYEKCFFALAGVLQKGLRRCCVLCVDKVGRQETNSKNYRQLKFSSPPSFQS